MSFGNSILDAVIISTPRILAKLSEFTKMKKFWFLITFLFVAVTLHPLLNEDYHIIKARNQAGQQAERLVAEVKEAGIKTSTERNFIQDVNGFVSVLIPFRASVDYDGDSSKVVPSLGRPAIVIRWDLFTISAAALLLFLVMLPSVFQPGEIKSKTNANTSVLPDGTKSSGAVGSTLEANVIVESEGSQSLRGIFTDEAAYARNQASGLFTRSHILIFAGVLMAFVGVIVFFASLPDPVQGEDYKIYAYRAVRSIGMLLFLEAIAWFLLRQYRNVIEDWKQFHRMYLKRTNYLAATVALEKVDIRPTDLVLVSALLSEDLTGKIKKNETTESIEGYKTGSDNPVFDIMQSILERTPLSGFDRSKSQSDAK